MRDKFRSAFFRGDEVERADSVQIALYLFKAGSGPATGDIAKVFISSPHEDDDGQYSYGVLPLPARPIRTGLK